MSSPHLKKLATYEASNQECAAIVLQDPERFPGLMQEWARAVLSGQKREKEPRSLA